MDITRIAVKCDVLAGGERRKPALETFTTTGNASESTSLTSVIFWRWLGPKTVAFASEKSEPRPKPKPWLCWLWLAGQKATAFGGENSTFWLSPDEIPGQTKDFLLVWL
jgi:hypothetical protein